MINVIVGVVLMLGGIITLIQEHPFWAIIFILLGASFLSAGTDMVFLPQIQESLPTFST